ncbi:MAG: hypothetical protein FJ276_32465, partial [Planctomycetes bacterium]|nr:hypothetical protein [Planctomycetota bacterium]
MTKHRHVRLNRRSSPAACVRTSWSWRLVTFRKNPSLLTLLLLASLSNLSIASAAIDTTAALVAAVRDGAEGATVEIAPGTYELEAPLELKAGMTLKGAGMDKTILTHTAAWKPSTKSLPDPEMTTKGMDTQAYLLRLKDKAANITISDLTLR